MDCVLRACTSRSIQRLATAVLATIILGTPVHAAEYWFPLGNGLGVLAATRNDDGRLELFARGSDGAIWHRWQDPSVAGGWTNWQSLGGSFSKDPTVAKAPDGHLEVFVRSDAGAVVQKGRTGTAPESGWSANWREIATGIAGNPVVTQSNAGLLTVFARANDGSIGYAAQQSSNPNAAWSAWTTLGGFVSGDPAIALNADGRLEVFVRTPDGVVWHKWQTAAGGAWFGWWDTLGGTASSNPAIGRNADGRLELFAITGQGLLWHRHQTAAGATTWMAEQTLGGDVLGSLVGTAGNLIGNLSIAYSDGGRLGVIARASNGRVWSKWQKTAGVDTWSVWISLCGISAADPVTSPPANGSPEIFVRAADNVVWHKRCDEQCLAQQGKSVPVLIYHAFSEAEPTWGERGLFVKPSEFRKQLDALTSLGYTPVQVQDLDSLCVIERPVLITVDDGYRNNYTDMYPILPEKGFKAVVFSITSLIGADQYLTESQMLQMRDRVSFQNHTVNHPDLATLSPAQVRAEMTQATSALQTLTGQTVLSIAYPYGSYNTSVKDIAREYFEFGFATPDGVYRLGQDRYTVPRIFVGRDDTVTSFLQKLRTCAHSESVTGGPLASGCGGNCTTTVCISQPSCCQVVWDQFCVNAARTQCDLATP
jgi:peptidoglycan/xylan/chitin deacetylase (PgdA/CDA1 family)